MNVTSTKPLHLCFVAPKARNCFVSLGASAHIGGAEVQQSLLARALAQRGIRVSLIHSDPAADAIEVVDGVTLVPCGYPAGTRAKSKKLRSLWTAMRWCKADVYYQRGAGAETGMVGLACRALGAKFVFSVASLSNAHWKSPECRTFADRLAYRTGLYFAHIVVCQTQTQALAMRRICSRPTIVIPSCALAPTSIAGPTAGEKGEVIWIGRIAPKKRFEWLLHVAALRPESRFLVVGDANAPGYAENLLAQAHAAKNIEWVGAIPHGSMDSYLRRAAVLLLTSPVEGFPNVFLEAWARGVPTVTSFDPDKIVQHNGLGAFAETPAGLAQAIQHLTADRALWSSCSIAARRYFEAHHTIDIAADAYGRLFEAITGLPVDALRKCATQQRSDSLVPI